MRTLLIVGLGLFLGACNCGPVTVADAGSFDAGFDAGVDAGFDAGVYVDAGPSRVAYKITSVTGTYTGDGVNVMTGPSRTDTLAVNTCNYVGSTDAGLLIGVDGGTPMIQVTGTAMCPAGMATSTGLPATCTAAATTAPAALFQGTIEMAGWADDSIVTFKITAPPSGMPGCNNARYTATFALAPLCGCTFA